MYSGNKSLIIYKTNNTKPNLHKFTSNTNTNNPPKLSPKNAKPSTYKSGLIQINGNS